MKRIVVIGPESSGKTTIAEHIAAHYGCVLVTEFARDYLDYLQRPYEQEDLLTIAQGQTDAEQSARVKIRLKANSKFSSRFKTKAQPTDLIICDTDLRVIRVWSMWKYNSCEAWIETQIKTIKTDLYLLCKPDIPWMPDPLRENPDPADLQALYELYKADLERDGQKYVEIEGDGKVRLAAAVRAVSRVL